jgi:hypothetical protein
MSRFQERLNGLIWDIRRNVAQLDWITGVLLTQQGLVTLAEPDDLCVLMALEAIWLC